MDHKNLILTTDKGFSYFNFFFSIRSVKIDFAFLLSLQVVLKIPSISSKDMLVIFHFIYTNKIPRDTQIKILITLAEGNISFSVRRNI